MNNRRRIENVIKAPSERDMAQREHNQRTTREAIEAVRVALGAGKRDAMERRFREIAQ